MNRIRHAALAIAITLLSGIVSAQQDFSKVEIRTTDLGHGTYMMEGQGGNMTLAVARDGAILVDGEFAPLHDKIRAAITAVTDKPVRYLVNTHFHGDHTGGNAGFAQEGTLIVANINVGKRLAAGTENGLTGQRTPPAPKDALPSKTYTNTTTLRLKGRTAKLAHPTGAHTDGDTYVYFSNANVLATGDIVTLGRYPNIDFANGGNIKGMIAGVDTYLKLANKDTKIVPGHGPLTNKAGLQEYREVLVTARDRVAKLIAEGKSVDEAVAEKPLADMTAKVGSNETADGNFVRVVYYSLKPKT